MELGIYGAGDPALILSNGISFISADWGGAELRAAAGAGLRAHAVAYAFPAGGRRPCVDPFGHEVSGFCPKSGATLAAMQERIAAIAKGGAAAAMTVDFCRYPSPFSGGAMFSCFCDECMAKMREEGLNAEEMRESAASLASYLFGEAEFPRGIERGLNEWLDFRERTVLRYFDGICAAAHDEGLRVGAYTFAPSLARLVGQNYQMLAKNADYLSPMLYRHWKREGGAACMDRELISLYGMCKKGKREGFFDLLRAIGGPDMAAFPGEEELMAGGVPPKAIGRELAPAGAPREKLVPIIQLDDERLRETFAMIKQNSPAGVELFRFYPEMFALAMAQISK